MERSGLSRTITLLGMILFTAGNSSAADQLHPGDQDIADSYIYLLGRLHLTRQQQLDFQEGFKWNEIVHRTPGAVDWPNPNLDVAYSQAWVAVDESSCTIVSAPKIQDRYFTVQFLNGWGETLANINERVFPRQSSGDFAVCLKGAQVRLPDGLTSRIDLPVKQARILARVALGDDPDAAVALQHQFKLAATGSPKLPEIPKTPIFELEKLPGVDTKMAGHARGSLESTGSTIWREPWSTKAGSGPTSSPKSSTIAVAPIRRAPNSMATTSIH